MLNDTALLCKDKSEFSYQIMFGDNNVIVYYDC